jgi:1,4-dihydroxy-6-naphthoate synthase
MLRQSVEFAFAHPEASDPYVREHAQEMEPAVMRQHIALYVNDYSISLGDQGKAAVENMYEKAVNLKLIKRLPPKIFV